MMISRVRCDRSICDHCSTGSENQTIAQQRIVLVGPGAAGMGIIETIAAYFVSNTQTIDATDHIWLVVGWLNHGEYS